MAKETILVVEDDEDIQELLKFNLGKEGYVVTGVTSGDKALELLGRRTFDLILLDLMLPTMDGLEVCRRLRRESRHQGVAVVILTAKGEETDVVTGLEVGADDYVTKPFSPKVLVARIRNVLRRKNSGPTDEQAVVKTGDMEIHPGRHEVLIKGKPVELTFTEFRLLQLLARRPGWVFTRKQIVDMVRGADYPVTERAVDVQVVGLRKKLGTHGKYIETVRGVGYRFQE